MEEILRYISPIHKELFYSVHNRHLKAMGTAEQSKHGLESITRVTWDEEEMTLKVYYDNDSWYHYDSSGDWY